jgi:hypothetical protein
LSSNETARVTAHIAGCAWCQRELALYDAVDQAARRRLASIPFEPIRLEDIVQAPKPLPTPGASRREPSRGPHRRHSVRRPALTAASSLAAVLAILLLAVFLFTSRGVGGRSVLPTATEGAPTAQAQVGGLEARMQVVIAGPYFLRELLPVDVSLANHTQQVVVLAGLNTTATRCHDSALMARLTAGSDPSFAFPPLAMGVSCTQEAYQTQVQPGETLTIHQYVPLTRSGAVTLSMQSASASTPTNPLPPTTPVPFPPLDGHWPRVQLQVQSQVPPNRGLTLQEQSGRVRINTPADAPTQLLAMQSLVCDQPLSLQSDAQWRSLASNLMVEPTCPSGQPRWFYIVSAPGYSIVSSSQ